LHDDAQLYRIVVHKDDTLWKAEPFHGRHDVVLYRFSGNGEGDFRVEQTAFPDMARYGNTAAEQVHKSLGYRKAEPEAFRRNVWRRPFKRSEYAFYRFLVHADARVLHLHGHYHVLVAYPETDCSVAGELDSVSQQVVRHLTDTVRISVYHYVGAFCFRFEDQ